MKRDDALFSLIEQALPKTRSIVTPGSAETVELIRERHQAVVHRYPTDSVHATWPIPVEWNVRSASVRENGRLVASLDESPLFVAAYSAGFRGRVSREELLAHTFSNPAQPDAFCYEFRLAYNYARRLKEWRIAMPHGRVATLGVGPFDVEIDVETRPGHMLIAELAHPGRSGSWFTFLAHYCHTAQANDGLAGVAIMIEAIERIRRKYPVPTHGYKALFMPETIGSSVYAANHPEEIDRTIGAVFSEMGGANADFQLVLSRRADTYIDRVFLHVLRAMGKAPRRLLPFRQGWGNDELVFDAPGVGVPTVSLDRYPFAAYHTHHDDLSLLRIERIHEVADVLLGVVDVLERDFIPSPRHRVPVYLTRYGLYADWTTQRAQYDLNAIVLDNLWTGLSVLDIALKHELDVGMVQAYVDRLVDNELVDRAPITPEYSRASRFLPVSLRGIESASP